MNKKTENLSAHITESTLLQPAIQSWKIFLRDQGRSHHTLKAFEADLQLLEVFLPTDKQIGQISTKDLENFLYWLEKDRGVPCSPKTLSRRITSLKSFFRWLTQNAVIPTDPAEKIVQKTVSSPLPIVLSRQELAAALEAADELRKADNQDFRPYVLLKLVLETALKKGECLNLKTNHLELSNPDEAFIFVRYPNQRYRFKERKIEVSPDWVEAYLQYAEKHQITEQVFPWSQRRLEYLLEDVTNAAKMDKHISFDMLRWTSALNDFSNGIAQDTIRQKLGVSKIQWREVKHKLHNLAEQNGYALPDEEEQPN